VAIVSSGDVGRTARIDCASREFHETCLDPVARQAKEQLLDTEMAGVDWLLGSISWKVEPQRSAQREADALPCVEGQVAAEPSFDPTDRATRDAGALPELFLCPPTSVPRAPDIGAKSRKLLGVGATRLREELWA
jgi:hypothetical protein